MFWNWWVGHHKMHIAAHFETETNIERNIEEVLIALGRPGEIETFDNGRSYVRLA